MVFFQVNFLLPGHHYYTQRLGMGFTWGADQLLWIYSGLRTWVSATSPELRLYSCVMPSVKARERWYWIRLPDSLTPISSSHSGQTAKKTRPDGAPPQDGHNNLFSEALAWKYASWVISHLLQGKSQHACWLDYLVLFWLLAYEHLTYGSFLRSVLAPEPRSTVGFIRSVYVHCFLWVRTFYGDLINAPRN